MSCAKPKTQPEKDREVLNANPRGMSMKAASVFSFVLLSLIVAGSAFAGTPRDLGDYVWYDADCDGEQNEPAEFGLNDVRVMFFRDYECNGVIDGYDELYDYAFTTDDEFGNPGFYSVPALSSFCFVAFLDPAFAPEGLFATTEESVVVGLGDTTFTDADFGLGDCADEPEVPDYTCPKTIGFWKQQLDQSRAAKFNRDEINAIVTYALTMTDVFSSYGDMQRALNYTGREGATARAKKQYAGVLLNVAAYDLADGLSEQVGFSWDTAIDLPMTDAETVGEAVDLLEAWIMAGVNLCTANDLADALNNGNGMEVSCDEDREGGCRGRGHDGRGYHGGYRGHHGRHR